MTDEYDPFDSPENAGSSDGLPCVELEFSTLRRFREEMAPYLNYDGFFARTERPLARDTLVQFKFVMPEDFALAEGTALVAWVIDAEGNPDLVPGMALRFVDVGQQSRAVIDELVDFHIATGGDPFNLGPSASAAGEIPTDALVASEVDTPTLFEDQPPILNRPAPPPEAEAPSPPLTSDDGVLPDWLSQRAEKDEFKLDSPPGPESPPPEPPKSRDLLADSSNDGFEVEMIFDDGSSDTTPVRPDDEGPHEMEMAPAEERKPPRDLRLGLIVIAAIVVIAAVTLMWFFWSGERASEVADIPAVVEPDAAPGVALIEDESAGEAEPAADSESEDPIAGGTGEATPEATSEGAGATMPTKVFVRENAPAVSIPVAAPEPATRVVDVVAAARDGMTTVVIRGNGVFSDSSLRVSRITEPLRLWLRVRDIETFYKPNEIEVGSAEVHRVRIGYHPEDNPAALWIVLDLVDEDVVLLEKSIQGDAIRVAVGRR